MENLESLIKEHAFFADLEPEFLKIVVGCASNVVFKEKDVIINEGDAAQKFYLIRSGKVALYIAHPQTITVQTLWEGDILGWSWLVHPYVYRFSAKALEETRTMAIDGKCLREKCEESKSLGYEVLKRLANVLTKRLDATMLRIIELSQ